MRGAKQTVLFVAVLLAVTTSLQAQIPWVTSWQEAAVQAQRNQRLVLIHFSSNNCPPCVKLERTVYNRPEMIRSMATSYVPLKVNVDQQPDLARHFGVQQWPTDIIVTPQGQELYRGASPQEVNRYIATLDQVASHARLGLPVSGSPSTVAAAGPSAASEATRGSSFPLGPGAGNASGPPAFSGNPIANPSISAPGAQPQGAAPPRQVASPAPTSSAVVNNQFVTGRSAGPEGAVHDQQASFNTPGGGAFQLPGQVGPQRPAPAQQQNPHAAGPIGTSGGPPWNVAVSGPTPDPRRPQAADEVPKGPPTLAMEGYCCVRLVEKEEWVKGDPRWGAVHRGRTYLFSGPDQQKQFLAGFGKYAPALSGYDCVKYAESRALVEGKRAHGVFYGGQIFLFADEAALQAFWSAPDRYVPLVQAEQDRQAARQ